MADQPVERVEKGGAPGRTSRVRRCHQVNDYTVVERGRFFDQPALAACKNSIASRKRPWRFLQLATSGHRVLLRDGWDEARSGHEESNRRAEMRMGIVEEFSHEGMVVENPLYEPSLDALASTMNHAQLPQTCGVRRVYVFIDDGRDILWGEGV
jgi:hypothetical protein